MKNIFYQIKNPLILLLTASIWGVAFVAQSVGGKATGSFTFNCIRSLLGALVLIPVIFLINKATNTERNRTQNKNKKTLLLGGVSCGVLLCIATNFQQVGMMYTTAGKAGFLTACYILIVPILTLFLGRKCSKKIIGCVIIAVIGLYYLCLAGQNDLSFEFGDILELITAFFFALHIIVIDYFSPKVNGVKMSCIQFFVCGLLSAIPMLLFEQPNVESITAAGYPILYAGIMSCGVAYTLQIIGQKNFNPTIASLIMSLESVISVIAGWILLGEKLSSYEMTGCILLFSAIIISQLPDFKYIIKKNGD